VEYNEAGSSNGGKKTSSTDDDNSENGMFKQLFTLLSGKLDPPSAGAGNSAGDSPKICISFGFHKSTGFPADSIRVSLNNETLEGAYVKARAVNPELPSIDLITQFEIANQDLGENIVIKAEHAAKRKVSNYEDSTVYPKKRMSVVMK
jgi:hypothetical protein